MHTGAALLRRDLLPRKRGSLSCAASAILEGSSSGEIAQRVARRASVPDRRPEARWRQILELLLLSVASDLLQQQFLRRRFRCTDAESSSSYPTRSCSKWTS